MSEQRVNARQGFAKERPRGRRATPWRVGVAAALAAMVATASGGFLIASVQAARNTAVEQRFDSRQANASRFIEAYVAQLMSEENRLAEKEFTGTVAPARFDEIVGYSHFNAAVLLDFSGRLLAVTPSKPGIIGTQIGSQYAHLRSALAGTATASDVVPSANQREPVIGFAVPFNTSRGRRVFSGAYAIAETPLQPFITSALVNFRTANVYLVDSTGIVISTDRSGCVGLPLQRVDPALARQASQHRAGYFDQDRQRHHYISGKITGTPWQLIFTLDSAELFQASTPLHRWTPWAALAAFLAMGLSMTVMLVRVLVRGAQAEDEHASQRAILDTASDAYIGMDAAGLVSEWNTAAARLLGWSRHEAVGQPVSTVMIPPRDRVAHSEGLHSFLATGIERLPRHPINLTAQHRDGRQIPVELTVSRSHWQNTWRFHAFVRDITDRLEHEQQLRELALTDSLTGLANHRAFLERLEQAYARARRRDARLVVLFADVDHFKRINDTYGHAAGDAILRDVANRLGAQFRAEDTIGRLGGDEFAVICEDFIGDLDDLAARVQAALSVPYSFRGNAILATVSIGHATPNRDDTAQHLLERADATMYRAKAASRA